MRYATVFGMLMIASVSYAQEEASLGDAILFYASFDRSADADFSQGDGKIHTAESVKRARIQPGLHSEAVRVDREQGRYGGSLALSAKADPVVFFQGAGNVPPPVEGFEGTFSLWLRTSPDQDLPPGFVDPLQITDKSWNDASFFVDFTKDDPRQLRLGVFSDYAVWNPEGRKLNAIPDDQRPIITVANPPFARDSWTHLAITFHGFNDPDSAGVATLYLNGKSQGELQGPQQFSWNAEQLAIMLGLNYVGHLDELAVFSRALSADDVQRLYQLPHGLKPLIRP